MKILYLLLLLFLHAVPASAQFDDLKPASSGDAVFGVESNSASFLPVEEAYRLLATLQNGNVRLQWHIADGYYLYKERFAARDLDSESAPLTLQLPQGKRKQDEFFGEVEVFYQQVTAELAVPADANVFQLQVTSQGCADAGLCYPPYKQFFRVDMRANSVTPMDAASATDTAGLTRSNEIAAVVAPPVSASPGLMFVFAFLGGVILNLMPCVFPILALKVLGLVQANAESAHQRRLHGLTYTAGVLLSFLLIATVLLALRAAGDALGWGFQLQSPWVVASLIYLFFVLGLSLSGVIEISGRWVGVGQGFTEKSGALGSFFTGVLAVIVASPCTAPFMGTAMGFALTQPVAIGLAVFLALGLGMAAPFLLLVSVPALARLLPKPGAWMNTLKEVLAFPLYATAIWLLWVIGRQTGANGMAAVLGGCLLLVLALWLGRRGSTSLRAGGMVAAALAIALLATPLLDPADPDRVDSEASYTATRLQERRSEGNPVFLNVTADWCVTCIANERVALSSAAVKEAFASNNVAYMKGDWTNSAPTITALLTQYGRTGVPLYLLFPADPTAPPVILPQILTPGLVVDALDKLLAVDNG